MRKKIISLAIFVLIFRGYCYSSEWFDKNKELSVVFHKNVWAYIENANNVDSSGRLKEADLWLSRAEKKIEETRPFITGSWPSGWPYDTKALAFLKYATPDAYLYRIIGDYAYSHQKVKEAIEYYNRYIVHSIIPDTSYMAKLAEIYEKEGMLKEARIMYEDIYKAIESRNFHGTNFTLNYINKKIKNIDIKMKRVVLLLLDVYYSNIPDYIKGDFQKLFIDEMNKMNNFSIIPKGNFTKILSEEKLTDSDLQYPEELSMVGKILNADYIVKPSLTKIERYYIFHVDVFDPQKKLWFDNYEYKTESPIYLTNIIQRFTTQFQGRDIPDSLLLPETEFLWEYEFDSPVTDIKLSDNGKRIIAGCESGSIYILTSKGVVLKRFKSSEKILKVAISPCGEYYSWGTLNGIVYFGDIRGIKWQEKTGNYIRDIDISKEGRFMVCGINNKIIFKDGKGETFWEENVPQWLTRIEISEDSHKIFAGMENGEYWCFSDEGNILWKKNFNDRIVSIKISDNYNGVVTEKGKTFILGSSGNEIVNFESGKNIEFTYAASDPEIIKLMSGKKRGNFFFVSRDKSQLWEYSIREKIDFIDALSDGSLIISTEGKDMFAFRIIWK
ncbi:MAG: CsgG/HfaB family protein [Candidatus Ratteibacteria bacterium]|nr:CsgG/HfaB family protein [Candidatus Ratteibacteria bacterium]